MKGLAKLFWTFYFISTGLHGLHMIDGVILAAWIAHGARANRSLTRAYYTPVEIVGLYWSFVDMVWLHAVPVDIPRSRMQAMSHSPHPSPSG